MSCNCSTSLSIFGCFLNIICFLFQRIFKAIVIDVIFFKFSLQDTISFIRFMQLSLKWLHFGVLFIQLLLYFFVLFKQIRTDTFWDFQDRFCSIGFEFRVHFWTLCGAQRDFWISSTPRREYCFAAQSQLWRIPFLKVTRSIMCAFENQNIAIAIRDSFCSKKTQIGFREQCRNNLTVLESCF